VSDVVLDASVLLKWFHTEGEPNVEPATKLRARFEAGELSVVVPALLWLEVLNVAARRLRWPQDRLGQLATRLAALRFAVLEPELPRVAEWAGRGLTAYDAAYVAIAEHTGAQLITDDAELVRQAPELAVALAESAGSSDGAGSEPGDTSD
jgi:predicted nucleic acid-binding protein